MDFWDYRALGYEIYRPDPEEPGSWRDLYWWRVILRMHNEWEAAKYDGDDDSQSGPANHPTPDDDGAVRRKPGAGRKMPTLPSQRKK